MSVVRVCTIMMLAVSLCAADLLAQGLGAVAARTAEERKALTMQRADARAHAATLDPPVSPLQSANTTFMHELYVAIRALEHTLGASDSWLLPMPSARLRY